MRILVTLAGVLLWLPAIAIAELLIRLAEKALPAMLIGILWLDILIAGFVISPAVAAVVVGLIQLVVQPRQPVCQQTVL